MKLSLKWMKEYIDLDLPPEKIGEILTDIGLEVEGQEEVENIKGGLRGLVIGKVITCDKHPNADRLSLTTVDIGEGEPLQIVCGAPNVASGQKVVVAPVGTTLYSAEGESWKIKKGKIRGEVSEGMICAEDEIGLSNDHSGTIELPEDTPIGLQAKEFYNLESDFVYDIGLTPNRSDATSHLGSVKDLAAALKINYGHSGHVNIPDVNHFTIDNNDFAIEVVVEDEVGCPRYSGISITGIEIKQSPEWLRNRLEAIGVRSISNIVDITNFILHELGQPLHAFDLDKIAGQKIIVKTLPQDTPFTTLDEKERKLHPEDLMICDGDSQGMCIAGVFGGMHSGVTEETTNIFLESAHFNAKQLRRSSSRHLLFTDASKVFEKGSDPNNTVFALKRAAMLIKELAGGEISSEIVDIYPKVIEKQKVKIRYSYVRRHIGVDISKKEIKDILDALHIDIVEQDKDGLIVAIPTDKSDVTREVDVIEEIIRIYGFNKIPIPDNISSSVVFTDGIDPKSLREAAARYLISNGFSEMMSMSLTQSKYADQVLPFDDKDLVYVNNTSNIHLDIMRPTLLYGCLEAVAHNHNRQEENLNLFEFGRSYLKEGDGFNESEHLVLTMSGDYQGESWKPNSSKTDIYTLKGLVKNILTRLSFSSFKVQDAPETIYDYGLSYMSGRDCLVSFGKLKSDILAAMGIKKDVHFVDFNWDLLTQRRSKKRIIYEPLNKFPTMRRDLAVVIDEDVKFDQLATIARQSGKKILSSVNLFDVYKNAKQLGPGKKSYALSMVFEDKEQTLKDKQVEKIMNNLIRRYESELGATVRS
ncbi:MAG: phenylalanine--tRNA ligase subunit beta [Bacteroidia bacterium]|nr:phenylalanine--tRNA ligase subunit beta [Bacteroidia bacterium]